MNNIWIITAREYFTRVKKRSFILMTLLTPLLISAFYGIIIWVSVGQSTSSESKHIAVVDASGIFQNKLKGQKNLDFIFQNHYSADDLINSDNIDAALYISKDFKLDEVLNLKYESMSSLSVSDNEAIERAFQNVLKNQKLQKAGVSQESIDSLKSTVNINPFKVDKNGNVKTSNLGINTVLGIALAFMIYFFIFLYGVQVMKGVIEEKTSRIVELIISTVKPFQLMMGKVIGIALVGLTQLGIWVVLSTLFFGIISLLVGINMADAEALQQVSSNPALQNLDADFAKNIEAFFSLPLLKIFLTFIFYFLGGYLFYGALFAAIGSAVDSETDTQQFMLPITLPLVFSFAISFSIVIGDPNGTLATWMSIIPISSPIVMMVRMPFDPPLWEIIVSMLVMITSITGVIWLAGKIYRTGILMYGKKPTYKELAKWLFYKN